MEHKVLEKFGGLFAKKNRTVIFAALLAAGALLIAAGGFSEKKQGAADAAQHDDDEYNAQYAARMQQDIEAFITQIDGVGSASVLVSLETGVQYEYAADGKVSDDTTRSGQDSYSSRTSEENSIIIVDGQALVRRRIEPTVQGVVIVCEGGGSARVREDVTEAVSVLCGIGANRISVTKMP